MDEKIPAEPLLQRQEAAWEWGDVVLDSEGSVWQRASPDDQEQGWPWRHGADITYDFVHVLPVVSEGSHREDDPARPLTLLVRQGRPVGMVVVGDDH
ncbi:hypothetical protein [Streptomyces sp. TR02-1]|uniref:hypothetical protein n=1 Tax=Streptomyces sp. TR02-1 TaxID=3385977 RepID=UPI0039A21B99